ncbi:hypothetical protein BZA70DRAFT_275498 [Myxozyma melibiosi]|uniref:Uncharacterized protein n=1 Tax=Myxozyma melibiosi TaxID=54550 RepID=A0ABR1F861_9ASCO
MSLPQDSHDPAASGRDHDSEPVVITATPVQVRRPVVPPSFAQQAPPPSAATHTPPPSTTSASAPNVTADQPSQHQQQQQQQQQTTDHHLLLDSGVAEAALANIITDPAFAESSDQISSQLHVHESESALAQAVRAVQAATESLESRMQLSLPSQSSPHKPRRQSASLTGVQRNAANAAAVAAAAVASSSASASTPGSGAGARLCNRCKARKPEAFCDSCREQSRQHTSDTRKRKRDSELAGAGMAAGLLGRTAAGSMISADGSSVPASAGGNGEHSGSNTMTLGSGNNADPFIISNYSEFARLFPVPGRPGDDDNTIEVDPETNNGMTHVPLHQKSFILQSCVSLDGGLSTIDDMLKDVHEEPVELFKTVIQRIFDISGYYFARRARTKSPKSYRIQYVCSQVADTSNNRNPFKPAKRSRSRRELYNCHGRLILAASYTDHSVVVKYTHHIVHGSATRRRYLSEAVKRHIMRNREKPLSVIFSAIRDLGPEAGSQAELDSVTRKQVYIFLKRLEDAERSWHAASAEGGENGGGQDSGVPGGQQKVDPHEDVQGVVVGNRPRHMTEEDLIFERLAAEED